ncbi:MAG: alanine racemase [Acidiferrobacterales bacterium]|nr:alanine racemase [Acidiferrobacterales bacterium]
MRRRLFLGSALAWAISVFIAKPKRQGGPHSPYFAALNQELKQAGAHKPSLLIDLDQLDKNISATLAAVNPNAAYRIPVKSLPSVDLLRHVMKKASTNKLMVFHIPFLHIIAAEFPRSDVLFGKPMPVQAARSFYKAHSPNSNFNPEERVQWLIDSKHRLQQYLQLAQELNQTLRVNIEIDVGLHRGGITDVDTLTSMLNLIADQSEHLQFSGFMGYDPHVVKLPSFIKSKADAFAESQATYKSFVDAALQHRIEVKREDLCLNGAGSPTLSLHRHHTQCNDLTAGSCLVKPTDFDIETLDSMSPACFIATPVLKQRDGVNVPGLGDMTKLISVWDPNREQSFYIYGGRWIADYESPTGLVENPTLMNSTNQQLLNGSKAVELSVDDFVFLRPKQSEFVFLQFGDLHLIRGRRVLKQVWPVFSEGSIVG